MPAMKTMTIAGPLREGTHVEWKAGPGRIKSTIADARRPTDFAWTGKTLGIAANHAWRLEGNDGGTRVYTEESWSGLLPVIREGGVGGARDLGAVGGAGAGSLDAQPPGAQHDRPRGGAVPAGAASGQ